MPLSAQASTIPGQGWEFTIEALVPAGPSAVTGLGVAAQFNISLDYFFPDTIGKPLFSARWRRYALPPTNPRKVRQSDPDGSGFAVARCTGGARSHQLNSQVSARLFRSSAPAAPSH